MLRVLAVKKVDDASGNEVYWDRKWLGKIEPNQTEQPSPSELQAMALTNPQLNDYKFLSEMYEDDYFPDFLVDKCKAILVTLCQSIEAEQPKTTEALLALTHAATEEINGLEDEFLDNDSELETGAREALAEDFDLIVKAYGFDVDVEDVIATRSW